MASARSGPRLRYNNNETNRGDTGAGPVQEDRLSQIKSGQKGAEQSGIKKGCLVQMSQA